MLDSLSLSLTATDCESETDFPLSGQHAIMFWSVSGERVECVYASRSVLVTLAVCRDVAYAVRLLHAAKQSNQFTILSTENESMLSRSAKYHPRKMSQRPQRRCLLDSETHT